MAAISPISEMTLVAIRKASCLAFACSEVCPEILVSAAFSSLRSLLEMEKSSIDCSNSSWMSCMGQVLLFL